MRDSKCCCSSWAWAEAMARVTILFSMGTSSGTFAIDITRSTTLGAEQPHQVVLEREVEAGGSGVALAAGAAAQLVVDAAGLVAFGAQDVEAAELLDLVVFGGDRRGDPVEDGSVVRRGPPRGPRRSSSASAIASGLPPSMMSVPRPAMLVATVTAPLRPACATIWASRWWFLALRTSCRMPSLRSRADEHLGLLDGGGADEDGLARLVLLGDVVEDRGVLRLLGAVDLVGVVVADHRPVGGDRHDVQLVDLVELGGLGHGGAGHAAELLVEAEEVLEGDRGERLVLVLDRHAFLGLDGLVQALVVAAAGEDAAGVLVDDQDLAVHDDVVLVLLEVLLGLEGVVQVPDERGVVGLVEALDAELVLEVLHSAVQDRDGALLRVVLVVVRWPAARRGGPCRAAW